MENSSVPSNKEEGQIHFPPGFRFHPTDEELLTHYLNQKNNDAKFSHIAIVEVDIQKFEASDLPWITEMGDYEWYFFCQRIRKYQNCSKANRATEAGYWKSTGPDREIYRGGSLIGKRKTLVFYKGRPRSAEKTDWVMKEYRLDGKLSVHISSKPEENEWVICRVYEKTLEGEKTHISDMKRFESNGNGLGSSSLSLQGATMPLLSDSALTEEDQNFVSGVFYYDRFLRDQANFLCYSVMMENISVLSNKEEVQIFSGPGFRFHPTDQELLTHYLYQRTKNAKVSVAAIAEVDIQNFQPWDLPWKEKMGDYEWYFFCQRIRKYQNCSKANRATEAGYWKSTGPDREIYRGGSLIGKRKTLVFYKGRPRSAEKTDWVMKEYRLDGKLSVHIPSKPEENEWVICRVFEKTTGRKKTHISDIEV